MFKKFLWITAVTCSLVMSGSSFANHCRDSMEKMVGSLQLDKDQKEKIKPVLAQLKATLHDKAAQMKDLGNQIKAQEKSDTMDQSVVNGLVDKKAALIGDLMKAKVQAKHQIMGMLNPQQKQMIQNKMEKMEKRIAARYKSCHDDE